MVRHVTGYLGLFDLETPVLESKSIYSSAVSLVLSNLILKAYAGVKRWQAWSFQVTSRIVSNRFNLTNVAMFATPS